MAGKIIISGGARDGKKSFDKEYKIEVIRQVREFGRSAPDIAREFGIHVNTIYKWLKEYNNDGSNAFPRNGNLRPKDEEIRRSRKEKHKYQNRGPKESLRFQAYPKANII